MKRHCPLATKPRPSELRYLPAVPVVSVFMAPETEFEGVDRHPGQPAHAKVGSRSRYPWVAARHRSLPSDLARRWHLEPQPLLAPR
jgi:hypothetical protein